ncbi:hypothetical protein NX059_009677 [Plenodomus lindquistii]|nr:hypothetical protein NX059_009677 [Plenodomus lindquistii]
MSTRDEANSIHKTIEATIKLGADVDRIESEFQTWKNNSSSSINKSKSTNSDQDLRKICDKVKDLNHRCDDVLVDIRRKFTAEALKTYVHCYPSQSQKSAETTGSEWHKYAVNLRERVTALRRSVR